MNQIKKISRTEVGINLEKFYTWKGTVPKEMLQFIDTINLALDLPTLEENQVMLLAKFIIYEFATLTMREIEDAIFKAKAGKLNCNPADYNKLSLDFMGRILSAYKEYKQKQNLIKSMEQKEDEEILKIEYTKDDEKESYDFLEKIYKSGKLPFIANWGLAFKYMEDNNLISYTNDEKEKFKDDVVASIQEEIQYLRVNKKNYGQLANILQKPKYLKYECRKRIVTNYFENKYNL